MKETMPDKLALFLTVPEAARLMKVGKSKVYELCYQRIIPHLRLGRCVRIPRDAFLRWLEEQIDGGNHNRPLFGV